MYARFFRWASDRLHDDGVLAFVTNRSFIESRTFDGFRQAVAQEFNEIYVVDLGGDVRANPKLSGTKHNVFGIQTGVAISLLGQAARAKGLQDFLRPPAASSTRRRTSWAFWQAPRHRRSRWQRVEAGQKWRIWIKQTENDWDELIPVADKTTKARKARREEPAIFRLFSLGIETAA